MKTLLYTIDTENNAECFWDALQAQSGIEARWLSERCFLVSAASADALKRIAGWADGPDYAQHPITEIEPCDDCTLSGLLHMKGGRITWIQTRDIPNELNLRGTPVLDEDGVNMGNAVKFSIGLDGFNLYSDDDNGWSLIEA